MDQSFQIDIGKQRIDMLLGAKEGERLIDVAGGKCLMAPILNHHFRDFADKHVVFDDQDHGHEKSFGRDNLNFGSRNSPRRTHGIRSPFERYQGKGISLPGVESSVRNAVYFETAVGTDRKAVTEGVPLTSI
jgi:hypothetical protein